jgi:hypothetical protein
VSAMKRLGGFVFLAAALFLLITARRTMTSDQKESSVLIRRMADAQGRESEISRLKNAVQMDNLAVADSIVKHTDQGPALVAQAKDRAQLGQLEQAEKTLGSAAMQESALKDLQNHHWVVLGEFVGGGLLGLLGVGLML